MADPLGGWTEITSALNLLGQRTSEITQQIEYLKELIENIQEQNHAPNQYDINLTKIQQQVVELTLRMEYFVEEKRELIDIQLALINIRLEQALNIQRTQ